MMITRYPFERELPLPCKDHHSGAFHKCKVITSRVGDLFLKEEALINALKMST